MMRGTFANIRLKNQLAPGTEGGWTIHQPSGEKMSIYDAAMKYRDEHVPLIDSRRQGIRLGLIARLGGERHAFFSAFARCSRKASNAFTAATWSAWACFRSNSCREKPRHSLGLTGLEIFDIEGLAHNFEPRKKVKVKARAAGGGEKKFTAIARIDTPFEVAYYQHGGILQYVLRQMV